MKAQLRNDKTDKTEIEVDNESSGKAGARAGEFKVDAKDQDAMDFDSPLNTKEIKLGEIWVPIMLGKPVYREDGIQVPWRERQGLMPR